MISRYENIKKDFGMRLRYLFKENGIDTYQLHAIKDIALDLINKKFVPVTQNYYDDDTVRRAKIKSVSDTVRRHLDTLDVYSVNTHWIMIYHDYFECSYDFLMGEIDRPTQEKTDIHEVTGLNDKAIENLQHLATCDKAAAANGINSHLTQTLNDILSSDSIDIFIDAVYEYMHSDYTIPAYHDNGKIVPCKNPADSGAYTPGGGGTVTLLKSEEDPTDNIRIHIDREFLETVAQNKIMWHLAHIKRGLL